VRPSVGPSLEPPGSDSDDDDIMADMHRYTESHYVDLVHQHHSNNPRSLVHNDIELIKTHQRHVISSPLISDGTYLYVITINKSTTNPIGKKKRILITPLYRHQ
jgi:5,10-methylene-tetrahydrofolate dehydrogenase/methenyl tetrahydrofolate cyclohydrolase